MAHKLETAHISFGLVTIPVGIYSAIDEQDIHFNQLHAPCGSRIKQQRFCPVCNRNVNYDELVKGYEIAKEQYVRISQDELDQLEASESDAMQILEFVPLSAVDPIYYENTYYLVSEKLGEKAYLLLAQAMETMGRVALAKFVWRGKESLYVIRSVQGHLLLHRMHYQDEIRELEVRPRGDEKPGVAELKLATQLIESISSDTFDAKAYHDEYRQRVLDLIEQKSKGKILKLSSKAVKPATAVVDLMQRLKDSVAQTTQRKGARSSAILAQVPREVPKKANAGRR
jgi:DNA end-binding protein Ku